MDSEYQSFNVVECPEFRELLLYLGEGKIQDKNLPHRTKLTEMILNEFRTEYCKIKDDLKVWHDKFHVLQC